MSPGTLRNEIDKELADKMPYVQKMCRTLCSNGGGITLDFAKRDVDYLAVTAHVIDDQWQKIDFVIAFIPMPYGFVKTSPNVRTLVEVELFGMGITTNELQKLFITTDEGKNLMTYCLVRFIAGKDS